MKGVSRRHALALIGALALGKAHASPSSKPVQQAVQRPSFLHGETTVHPVASFSLSAQVLGMHPYSDGWKGQVSPLDLALGWGRLYERDVFNVARFWQADRFYHWAVKPNDLGFDGATITTQSANMHIVPSHDGLRGNLFALRPGDRVFLSGLLVDLAHKDEDMWLTSTVRDDVGDGACEIVFLTQARYITA